LGAVRLELGIELREVDPGDHRALLREPPRHVGHALIPSVGARQQQHETSSVAWGA